MNNVPLDMIESLAHCMDIVQVRQIILSVLFLIHLLFLKIPCKLTYRLYFAGFPTKMA